MAPPTVLPPETFARAVAELTAVRPRAEIQLADFPAPRALAPYSFALGASVLRDGDEVSTGRLILLHDPDGHDAWQGQWRLVTYVTAEIDPEMATDPLLPGVGWSWLLEALDARGADYTAAGGTITATTSSRFGELSGPPTTADLEIRASWSPLDPATLGPHLDAWCVLLADTAGLPPPGTTRLGTG